MRSGAAISRFLHDDVGARLHQHGQRDTADIQVEVRGAEVRLTGHLDSDGVEALAEETAAR